MRGGFEREGRGVKRGPRAVQVYVLLVGCILIAILLWRQVEAYRHIAMTG